MKRETDIEALNATVPEVPSYFERWMQVHMPPVLIFYRREKKGASCMCGKCGIGYHTDETPERCAAAVCQWCGVKGIYEWKKVTRKRIENRFFSILQVTSDGKLVLCTFWRKQTVQQECRSREETTELERAFFDLSGTKVIHSRMAYCAGRWERCWDYGNSRDIGGVEELYPGYDAAIRETDMKYCDADLLGSMVYRNLNGWNLKRVLTAYAMNPAIEMYAKSGMEKLVDSLVQNGGTSRYIYRKGKTVQKQLRLKDKTLLKKFIKAKGDMSLLPVLQYEQKNGVRWNEEEEQFAVECMDNLPVLLRYMSIRQLMNRIEKYSKEKNSYGVEATVRRYRDYLLMREELGYDMSNEIYIHPKNLRNKHDELANEKDAKKDELRAVKADRKFCKIAENYEKIKWKYGYEEEGYFIRPAKSASEIILEGQYLHHCVGRNDHYMNKHNNGTSYIVFLRRKSEPDVPYYTVEIKGEEVIQWYSMNDRKPDREIIEPLLERWTEQLKRQ